MVPPNCCTTGEGVDVRFHLRNASSIDAKVTTPRLVKGLSVGGIPGYSPDYTLSGGNHRHNTVTLGNQLGDVDLMITQGMVSRYCCSRRTSSL